jgi:hypothetical protein
MMMMKKFITPRGLRPIAITQLLNHSEMVNPDEHWFILKESLQRTKHNHSDGGTNHSHGALVFKSPIDDKGLISYIKGALEINNLKDTRPMLCLSPITRSI